jgi:hypothetical protein
MRSRRPTWFLEFDWVIQNEIISVHDKVCSPDSPLTRAGNEKKKKNPPKPIIIKTIMKVCLERRYNAMYDKSFKYSRFRITVPNGELRDPAQDSRYEHPAVEVCKKARHRSPCVVTLGDRDNRIGD